MDNDLSHIILKAWTDQDFKEKLIKNPLATLKSEGISVPEGVKVTVCENTDHQFYLVLPSSSSEELSDEQLAAISGGLDVTWHKNVYGLPSMRFSGEGTKAEIAAERAKGPPAGWDA